jgi:Protein of unknown function (DUF3710)
VKFRRSTSDQSVPDDVDTGQVPAQDEREAAAAAAPRAQGPWDASEVALDEADPTRIDLGGLVVTGRPGLELRLQVDEATQRVAAVLLVGKDGAVEIRPFAAPRGSDIWDDIRRQIAAETARRGGTATEAAGVYGKELQVVMPVTTPDGKSATQPSRVLGISGPRWLLRATFLGRPAVAPQPDGDLETALRSVVVVRGNEPMAPGDPLPLSMPANAQPLQPRQA